MYGHKTTVKGNGALSISPTGTLIATDRLKPLCFTAAEMKGVHRRAEKRPAESSGAALLDDGFQKEQQISVSWLASFQTSHKLLVLEQCPSMCMPQRSVDMFLA